jgi:HAD superfamily hydrolase (TIGR01484 family)
MRADIRLISTDFDGTIHEDFADAAIPLALQDALARLQADGVCWVINTGRDLSSLMESLGRAHCRVQPDYVVTVEREIHQHVRGHYQAVEPWNTNCTRDHADIFTQHMTGLDQLLTNLESKYDASFYRDGWSPLCAIARSNSQMDAIQAELEAFCAVAGGLVPVRNDVYVRLSHRLYSKGTALQEIQRRLHLTPAQTMAAGDHLNDLPMLRREIAEWLVTPLNGLPVVKAQVQAHGGHLAARNCGEGVLEALALFGL